MIFLFFAVLSQQNNLIFSDDSNEVLSEIVHTAKNVFIPSCVRIIGPFAAKASEMLETLELEENSCLHRICKYAFSKCQNVRFVDFSPCSKLWVVEEGSFYNTGLEEIIFPESLKNIEKLAFSETKIRAVKFPDQTIIIGEKAFFFSLIEEIVFSDHSKLHQIQSHAFARTCIRSIILPEFVEDIQPGAFASTSLYNISFKGLNPTFEIINETIVTRLSRRLVASFVHSNDTVIITNNIIEISAGSFVYSKLLHVIIPPSVRTIRERAFAYSSLVNLVIPSMVMIVEKYAFLHCDMLQELKIESASTILMPRAFSQTGIRCGVKCPLNAIQNLRLAGIPVYAFQKCPSTISNVHDKEE